MKNDDNIMILKAALLYIIQKSEENKRDVYAIVKTAFYAQQIHLAQSGSPLFKDVICALPFGPVPSNMYDILKLARGDENELTYHKADGFVDVAASIGWEDEFFFAKESPDMDYLSELDIFSLDEAIKRVAKMSFNEIRNDTHGEEWNRVFHSNKSGKKIMDPLNIAKEGGADDSTLAYLKDYLELEQALG